MTAIRATVTHTGNTAAVADACETALSGTGATVIYSGPRPDHQPEQILLQRAGRTVFQALCLYPGQTLVVADDGTWRIEHADTAVAS